ncbi:hypothetical protein VP1G_11167 [Cytospora mali]|uniref:Uncharacterized protein n=1 Tax=Cytospora mali TaxID=578113 RepID=A0A194V899_CYTMA|nr:hypothetical protein VP1G_11167 [Valsa mali var. pyri (nom. inval.)]
MGGAGTTIMGMLGDRATNGFFRKYLLGALPPVFSIFNQAPLFFLLSTSAVNGPIGDDPLAMLPSSPTGFSKASPSLPPFLVYPGRLEWTLKHSAHIISPYCENLPIASAAIDDGNMIAMFRRRHCASQTAA